MKSLIYFCIEFLEVIDLVLQIIMSLLIPTITRKPHIAIYNLRATTNMYDIHSFMKTTVNYLFGGAIHNASIGLR